MEVVETKVAACPLGRGLHTRWRADAHLSRAQGRHLRASGRCQYPPQPSRLERRAERRLALRCLAPRAGEPGNSCVFLAHLPSIARLSMQSLRHLAAALMPWSGAPVPPLLGHSRLSSSITVTTECISSPTTPDGYPRLTIPQYPASLSAAHANFVYRLSEALGTPPPRAAYSPTSGVSVGRAHVRRALPAVPPPTHDRIPSQRTSTAHSIDTDHPHSTNTMLIKRAQIRLTEVGNSGYFY
jgi:hypothetical protein